MWKVVTEKTGDGKTQLYFVNEAFGVKQTLSKPAKDEKDLNEQLKDAERECIERDYFDAIGSDIAKRIRESGLAWAEFSEEDIAILGERIKRFNSDKQRSRNSISQRGEDMRWQLQLALDRAAQFLGMDTSNWETQEELEFRAYKEKGPLCF